MVRNKQFPSSPLKENLNWKSKENMRSLISIVSISGEATVKRPIQTLWVFAFKCDHTDAGSLWIELILRSNVTDFP